MTRASLLGAGLLLSLALMVGRLTGLMRELMLAATFGISAEADAAIVLLILPDLLVNLLLSGGLSVALIPAMRQAAEDNRHALMWQSSMLVFLLFGIVGISFAVLPQWWFAVMAPGISLQTLSLDISMLSGLAIAIPLTALSGVTTATLNAQDRFFIAGCGTLIFNCSVLAALWLSSVNQFNGLLCLSTGIAVGAFLRFGSQSLVVMLAHHGSLRLRGHKWLITHDLIKTFIAGLTATSLLIFVPVAIRAGASFLGEGQLAVFNYAMKLVELPLGILITTLATIAYPKLSQAFAEKSEDIFDYVLNDALLKSMILSVAVAICGWQFSDAAVQLLFGFGRVTGVQRAEISALTQIAMLSVPLVGIAGLITAALNAREKSRTVLRYNFMALIALSVMIVPGLIEKSALLLMAALPGFYFLLTWLLCQTKGLLWVFWLLNALLRILSLMVIVFLPFGLLDYWIQNSLFDQEKLYLLSRIVCGLLSWMTMVYLGVKKIKID